MAGKKQHYVPQLLLRNFSPANDFGRICVYRIADARFLGLSSTKNQAHENNFYGVPEVEDGLAKLESDAHPIAEAAIKTETLPPHGSAAHNTLLTFALAQAARTRASANDRNTFTEAFVKRMLQDHPDVKDHLDGIQISHPNASIHGLASAFETMIHAYDLSYKLLCNRTAKPFILSDHPAVLYNQFLETRKKVGSNTGFAVKGLQLFLPLGPKHILMLYDGAVYTVGGRRLASQRAPVETDVDVFSLNLLQAVSAEHSLYFGLDTCRADVNKLMTKATKYRTSDRVDFREYPPAAGDAKHDGVLLRISNRDVRTHLKLRVVRLTPHAQAYNLGTQIIPFRQPDVRRALIEFDKAVQKGRYTRLQLDKFVDDLDSGEYVPDPPSTERFQIVQR